MNNKLPHQSIRFRLAISAEKYLAYYRGIARDIDARSDDDRNVRFPASAVQSFLTHEGIFGHFEIQFDENNKLIGVKRVE